MRAGGHAPLAAPERRRTVMADIAYRTADVDGQAVFYREAGASDAPTLVLLHGFPSASHMFRELIPLLADRFHIIAPDLPGFGKSDMPARGEFDYTFEHITDVIDRLTEMLGLDRFALYVFDYGAPVGFRIATRHPERITAIVSQNGNAYEEGLSEGWNPVQTYWKEPSKANREAIRMLAQRRRRDPARPVPRLCEQRGALPGVPGVLPHEQAAAARGVGQERPVLPAGRGRSLQARHPRGRRSLPRHRSLRPGDPRRGNRNRHPRLPRTDTVMTAPLRVRSSRTRRTGTATLRRCCFGQAGALSRQMQTPRQRKIGRRPNRPVRPSAGVRTRKESGGDALGLSRPA